LRQADLIGALNFRFLRQRDHRAQHDRPLDRNVVHRTRRAALSKRVDSWLSQVLNERLHFGITEIIDLKWQKDLTWLETCTCAI
jgi:hypothetical protein